MGGVCGTPINRVSEPTLMKSRGSSKVSKEEPMSVMRVPDRHQAVRKSVASSPPTECPSAHIEDRVKGPQDKELINSALSKHILFSTLQSDMKEILIQRMQHYTVEPGAIIFQQGTEASNFYIVERGKLQVIVNGSMVNEAKPGDGFGELALIQNTLRSATLRAGLRSSMWVIDRLTFRAALETLNRQCLDENRRFISSVPQLELLTPEQVEAMLGTVTDLQFAAGQKIVKEGDPGDLFFIIKEGSVVCTQEGREVRRLEVGEFFGEQALLYNTPRTATVTAVEDCKCLAIGRVLLQQALGNQLEKTVYRNSIRIAIDSSPVFSNLTSAQVNQVIERVQLSQYPRGTVAVSSGTPKGYCLWLVLRGNLQAQVSGVKYPRLTCIGDSYFVKADSKAFDHNIIALEHSVVAAIHKKELERITKGDIKNVLVNNQTLKALRQIELLRSLSAEKFQLLVNASTLATFEPRQQIVVENSSPDAFYIVKSGICEVVKNGVVIRTYGKLAYFGERSMLLGERRSATVIAQTQVECWVLSHDHFFSIIDGRMRSLLLKRIDLQDESVQLDDLALVKVLGSGMFGKVFLATHRRKSDVLYALKVVDKDRVVRLDTWQSLTLERNILLQMDHMFIVKLVKTLKDSRRIYFVMEYVQGMDLFDVIRQLGLLTDCDAKFYMACLVLIVEYMQDRDIVYRDFKPENIMVDDEGYPKLIDFGTAKITSGRTFTVVGTPHYMAPEVITGRGYGKSADLWSLGVILYELLCGGVPFGEGEEDPYAVYEAVLGGKLNYPAFITAKLKCKPMIEMLLSKNAVLRTGGSFANLKSQPWFADINWESLLSKSVRPPYTPRLPALATEVSRAREASVSLLSQIEVKCKQREEAINPMDRISRKAQNKPPADWDHDF
jgi:cGMP-dependent protein kinase